MEPLNFGAVNIPVPVGSMALQCYTARCRYASHESNCSKFSTNSNGKNLNSKECYGFYLLIPVPMHIFCVKALC